MKKKIFIICVMHILVASIFSLLTEQEIFLKAKNETDITTMQTLYENIYEENNNSFYGQNSLLELVKIDFFKREYQNAISLLKKIHDQNILDKQYWLAKSYLKLGKYQLSIISSQIFIAESEDNVKIEKAYFLIAEAYLQQKMHKRAFNTLESLRTSKYIKNNIPLLHYKMGICKEKQAKFEQALMFYKKLKQDFPYHQYCYLAEDRIYNLNKDERVEFDLSQISTFRQDEPVEESKAATGEDSTTLLTGLTFTNGNSIIIDRGGGGIYCYDSSPILQNITIINNTAQNMYGEGKGGGIYCENSNLSLVNVTISGNFSSYGGGIWYENSSPSLENVTITGNTGGGLFCCNSSPSLENVTITGNSGSGISCNASSPSLVDVTITSNSGSGISCLASSPSLVNVTISDNSADECGGILCDDNSSPSLINCIMWNDSPQEVYFIDYGDPNSITISYSDIQGGEAGITTNNNGTVSWLEGNLNEDPIFVGTGDHPFMLQDLSPCVNTGVPDTIGLNLPEYDLAGNQRVYGGRIDMGAYENQNVVGTSENLIPLVTKLNQNYPNPFNPSTTINYSLKENSKVLLSIYNIKGQKVKQLIRDQLSTGQHSVVWNGKDDNDKPVSSGVYFYRLYTGDNEKIRKMILMK